MQTARTDLPAPTEAEVQHLVDTIAGAWERGIRYGDWTLARYLLAAGYRLVSEPEPPKWGECRVCSQSVPLNENGALDDHDDQQTRPCMGAHMVPLRMVDPPEVVNANA